MLKDIVSIDGPDLGVAQTEAPRAGNILSVQIGDLEYAPNTGIDLRYFLTSEFKIQDESFKHYCVQSLLEQRINVVNVFETVNRLFATLTFDIGSSDNTGGFVA